ncbi:MAG: bifunctional 3-phosphoshikimate 1-carboxyvinyltransferase/cytidylate kinase [Proteobacteria bacterium]|nr:MAG: bifunctional 3-phosphoshikimate 1-carboxyvinyltransferase/cytidylate kinase [Pseudomonadota bacterium]
MKAYPTFLDLGPFTGASGSVRMPGSKSISNRTLLLAALAHGTTDLYDLLESDDVERMLDALRKLGVAVQTVGPEHVRVTGCGGRFPTSDADLFLGNAGTAFRPLTAALALNGGHYRLSGVPRMHERPIGDLVDALRGLGAQIHYLGQEGFPPLEIRQGAIQLNGIARVRGEVSSQFLTALLMALPMTGYRHTIEVEGELISKPYVDITLRQMALFGVDIARQAWSRFVVAAGSSYRTPGVIHVEGDASSASYFLAAGAIAGGPVRTEGVGRASVQGDIRFIDALAQMGARVALGDNWIEARAPERGSLRAFDLDLNHIPDAAMTLAVTALFADGPCRLRNIASWRVKETDRLAAMATELRKLGARVDEGQDQLVVVPPASSAWAQHAAIDTYDDHRMAMCFSLAAFAAPVRIRDPKCVAKTFPDYFERLAQIARAAPIPVVAIDGPSASGKGTVAKLVAERLGFHYLDSGALYRLVALAAMEAGLAFDDEPGVAGVAASLDAEFRNDHVFLAGKDVTESIRAEQVSSASSRVAALPRVREKLLQRQRDFRRAPGLVADGRDMGSMVFPDAQLKVYLTASAEERAERRYKQLIEKGIHANLNALLLDINQRDARDAGRTVAPLQRSADAYLLDTTGLSVERVVDQVLIWCRQALNQAPLRR